MNVFVRHVVNPRSSSNFLRADVFRTVFEARWRAVVLLSR